MTATNMAPTTNAEKMNIAAASVPDAETIIPASDMAPGFVAGIAGRLAGTRWRFRCVTRPPPAVSRWRHAVPPARLPRGTPYRGSSGATCLLHEAVDPAGGRHGSVQVFDGEARDLWAGVGQQRAVGTEGRRPGPGWRWTTRSEVHPRSQV